MRFYSLLTSEAVTEPTLENEYKSGREIGIIRLGATCFFFRRKLRKYYIPYKDISRCFRRVMTVPAKLCCGKGEFAIENLVLYVEDKEVAQIQLPGTKAARVLMDEMKSKAPQAQFSRPEDRNEAVKETDNDTK